MWKPAGAGAGAPLLTLNLAAQNPAFATPITRRRPDAVNNAFTTPGQSRVSGHNLTVRYELTDEISFKNVLAYRKVGSNNTYQLDGLGGVVNVLPLGPGLDGAPLIFLGNTGENRDSQWSNEFQININTQWFNVTAGYLHFDLKNVIGGFEGPSNVTQFAFLPGYVIPTQSVPNLHSRIKVKSDPWFVQPEIHLTSKLDLVAGARITVDRKSGVDNTSLTSLGPVIVNYRNSKPTYLLGVNYRPTDTKF